MSMKPDKKSKIDFYASDKTVIYPLAWFCIIIDFIISYFLLK